MARLTWQRLVSVALTLAGFSLLVNILVLRGGWTPIPVPWSVPIILVLTAVTVAWFGWRVRQYVGGKGPRVDLFVAARTALIAQASALTGAALVGVYGAYAAALAPDWGHPPRRALIVAGLVAVVAAGILLVAGLVAERWCLSSGKGDGPATGSGASAGASPEVA